jgi:ABC-type transporter Mla MlaB component
MSDTDQIERVEHVQQGERILVESLTISDCSPLYERIKSGLEDGESVCLDVSRCDDVDTAGLQLLVAIQNDLDVSLKVFWTQPSQTISDKAARLGLLSWIEAGARGI